MAYQPTAFILSAIDPDLDCPWLSVRFRTDDFGKLCQYADIDVGNDPQLNRGYLLASTTVAAVCKAFGIRFEHGSCDAFLHKHVRHGPDIPYLIHTGYELALMVQGRKPFAFIDFDSANPNSIIRKARFDAYVAKGVLHAREEIVEVTGQPGRRMGQTFYAVAGEAWRIPAFSFIHRNMNSQGDNFEPMQRLEGALLGYEPWQNDWWMDHLARSGVTAYGAPFICKVDRAQYDWLVHAGCRALPPFDMSTFVVHSPDRFSDEAMRRAMDADTDIEAFIQFNVGLKHIMHVADFRTTGPYEIPTSLVPTINRALSRSVRVLVCRNEPPELANARG